MSINTVNVEKVLEILALKNEKRFNAHQITVLSNETDVMAVNDYLIYRSAKPFGILEAKIETLCDNNHPDEHFELNEDLPEHEIICRVCGCEYIPDLEFSHLVFYFKDSFLDDVKKKSMNQSDLVTC